MHLTETQSITIRLLAERLSALEQQCNAIRGAIDEFVHLTYPGTIGKQYRIDDQNGQLIITIEEDEHVNG